jgi:pyridoxal phosphate enzyme (YggS family)
MEIYPTKIDIAGNVRSVSDMISSVAKECGREGELVKLVAVSKAVNAQKIEQALEAGIHCLGENKVQEGMEKRAQLAGYSYELHLIGPLQRNKVNKAVATFDWIETVDSIDLAVRIDRACASLNKVIPVLVQVKLAEEATKSGVLEKDLSGLVVLMAKLQHISLRGLMTIPPFSENPEEVRPHFRRLRELAERVDRLKIEAVSMRELSMGMSHDYSIAIEEGATIVRVGTAIFGERQYI